MFRKSWIRPALTGLVISGLLGCGGGGGGSGSSGDSGGTGGPSAALPADTTGTLYGQILARGSRAPLRHVAVTAGGQTVSTGPDGSYLLTNLPLGRTRVTLQAAGHVEDSFFADLNASLGRQRISRELHAVGTRQSFNPAAAQVLQDNRSLARVSLPANALVSPTGAAPVGSVTVEVTHNDPGPDGDPTSLPGDYQSASGAVQFYGAATFTFRDAQGQRLNLAAGQSAGIRIPGATGATGLPASPPLFHFNQGSGLWVPEGQATLRGAGATAYYEGTVTHFSTWGAGAAFNRISVSGRVVDEFGDAMAGVRVYSVGTDYTGSAQATTDASGHFSVYAKPSANIVLFAVANDGESPERALLTSTTDIALPAALVLPALTRARVTLGAPSVNSVTSTCCNVPDVQASFVVSGVNPSRVTVLSARWELGHSVPLTCVATATSYNCTGAGTISTVQWLVHWNPADRGGYLAMQLAGRAGDLTGTLGFKASVHYQTSDDPRTAQPLGDGSPSVTFGVVLVLDLQDAATGTVHTVRSQPATVTAN
jgi:hypothetical protein